MALPVLIAQPVTVTDKGRPAVMRLILVAVGLAALIIIGVVAAAGNPARQKTARISPVGPGSCIVQRAKVPRLQP
jgi:hypothetical protein